ncbi:cytochrome c oxidase assembly protein COX18, mitochondrial [Hyposmocoma kahamanoa]|uniref:cytochrome c oxidase assembly protein COX18, mitochondrial n=1 Tax=Hyposmocoma kahamanoa TaxID=1477025 RepID=UPI000E6D9DE1|nr:cytochrome c oxidase assembly protein COX18, mitochondrial [Hyposmocoma kahamanoa]
MICYKIATRLTRKIVLLNTRSFSGLSVNDTKYEKPLMNVSPSPRTHIILPHVSSKRHLSLEGFMKWQEQTYTCIANSNLVHVLQDGLVYFHDTTGLSWWATIVTSTILVRALMTLPLTVYQNYILAKVENIGLELKELVNELKKETAIAKTAYELSDKQTVALYKRSLKKQWRNLIERDNCHPFKASLVIWVQIPIWCTFLYVPLLDDIMQFWSPTEHHTLVSIFKKKAEDSRSSK